MIIKADPAKITKRWVYKLDALGLEKTKVDCGEGEELVPTIQPPKLIVSEETEDKARTYAVFSGYPELYRYINNHRKEMGGDPSLYEVCPHYMKMHFDIDLQVSGVDPEIVENKDKVILYPILVAFKDVLEKHFPGRFTDRVFVDSLVITESHTSEKISYHIIQDGFFMTSKECKYLYTETKDLLVKRSHELQADRIDHAVYGSNQNFRVYGCCKKNKKNVKSGYTGPDLVFGQERYSHQHLVNRLRTKYDTESPINMRILGASLISNIITSMRLNVPTFEKIMDIKQQLGNKTHSRKLDATDNTVYDIFNNHALSRANDGSPAFEMSYGLSGGITILNRIKSSFCSLCDRVHDEENIFLKIEMNNDIHYYCRRAQDEKQKKKKTAYIGNLTSLE